MGDELKELNKNKDPTVMFLEAVETRQTNSTTINPNFVEKRSTSSDETGTTSENLTSDSLEDKTENQRNFENLQSEKTKRILMVRKKKKKNFFGKKKKKKKKKK